MSTSSDLDVNRSIRRALVKHWIDLGRLAVRTTNGHAAIHGMLQRVEGHPEPILPATVEAIFTEIRRIPGLNRVRPHLENWTLESGSWRPVERAAFEQDGGTETITGLKKDPKGQKPQPDQPRQWRLIVGSDE